MSVSYIKDIPGICSWFKLGNILDEPQKINAGLTNTLYIFSTDKEKYVIKFLNKNHIDDLGLIELSEKISYIAKQNGVKSLPAISFGGKFIQEYDRNLFLLYEYFDGIILTSKEITDDNCRVLARELAKLHGIDTKSVQGLIPNNVSILATEINWEKYIDIAKLSNEQWAIKFVENAVKIVNIYKEVFRKYNLLSSQKTFTHKDYNRRNVLWNKDDFVIIDWETARLSNPSIDFFNSAWFLTDDVKYSKYVAFASEYFKYFNFEDDINISAYAAILDELIWLEYSLKRAMGMISENEDEIKLGKEQILSSMKEIINYYDKTDEMIKIIKECKEN